MGVYIKNGTPMDGPSLCETCTNACITRGYRESETIVVCQVTSPDRRIPFRVRECSRYVDMNRQTVWEMQKIAWVLNPKGNTRTVGFVRSGEVTDSKHELELILDKNNQ